MGALLPVYLTMLAEHLPSPFSSLSVHRIGIATFIQSILLGLGFGGFVGGLLYERLLLDIKQRKRLAVYGTLVLALSITPIIYHVPTFSTSVASSEELSPIEDAVWRDSIRDVRFLLNRGTPPSESERAEALGAAISIERADMVSAFVEAGTDINISGKWGYPLQNAVSKEHEAIIRILLEAGADTGLSTSKSSYPPLIKSARLGNLRILKLLLESHADIDI
ncbi:MAG: ankyrin repeat domain-containing protein [Cyanobacteria bacterium J06639_1]